MNSRGIGKGIIIAIVIVTVIVAFFGYWYGFKEDTVRPTVEDISFEWEETDFDSIEVRADATVYNPNPFRINIDLIRFTALANEMTLAEGEEHDVSLSSGGETDISLSANIYHEDIPRFLASHMNNDEETDFEMSVLAEVGVGGASYDYEFGESYSVESDFLREFNFEGEEVVYEFGTEDIPAEIILTSLNSYWGDSDEDEIEIIHEAVIYNPQDQSIPLDEIEVETEMNGINVGSASTGDPAVLAPGSHSEVTFRTVMEGDRIEAWWPTHIARGERTEIASTVYADVDTSGWAIPGFEDTHRVQLMDFSRTVSTDFFTPFEMF